MKYRYPGNGSSLKLDRDTCIGCQRCTEVCPHGVFDMLENKAVIIDKGGCMECGACARNCPVAALSVSVGVGCAAAIITGFLRGTEPCCDCGGDAGDRPRCC